MAFDNVGKVWTPASLAEYLESRAVPEWIDSITIHHTAAPSLAQRPKGFTIQHIRNIQDYYSRPKSKGGKLGWSSGPHLFIDEDEIFGMTDFRRKGIHARSFNGRSLGIEVLGDYDIEDPNSGRGKACWTNAAETVRVLLKWLGLKKNKSTILFHNEDPTTKKSCPGTRIEKKWFLDLIPSGVDIPDPEEYGKPPVGIDWKDWHFAGEQWCVPLYGFLTAKGVPSAEVLSKLKSKGGIIYYGEELINGGFYVAEGNSPTPDKTTWAPVRNLLEILEG